MNHLKLPIVVLVTTFIAVAGIFISRSLGSTPPNSDQPRPTSTPLPINVIPVTDRPYVSLQPLTGRNELAFIVHNLPKSADSVEVTLEYDRNKGVMDAVLKQFPVSNLPLKETIFMGTKSAGGHITYHDDVIGGSLTLKFNGNDPYTLKVPWRYSDTQKEYTEFSTADGYFQLSLAKAIKQTKVVIMQSPGIPGKLDGEILAGPYLIRTVGELPLTQANLKLRLPEETTSAQLYGYEDDSWHLIESTIDGKTLSASTNLYEVFTVVK